MRRLIDMTTMVLSLVTIVLGQPVVAQNAQGRPNFVLVLTDDQGYGDLGVHGNPHIKTPNLDRFAGESLEMTRFYVNPLCAPTRSSLMTGRYHLRTGILHTSRGAAKMAGDEVTIAELLAQAGYRTGIFGKWHLGDNYPMRPQDQGFQEVLVFRSGAITQTPDTEGTYFKPILWHNGTRVVREAYCTDIFFDAALEFIDANRNRPFFVYLPVNVPHKPLQVSEQYSQPYKAMGLSDNVAKLYGMLTNLDENFGRLIHKLDELNLRDNTLVIFLSDNGPTRGRYNCGMRGSKGSVYEGGIHVPFFVRWPDQIRHAGTTDRLGAHIDVLPTLLAAAGIQPPPKLVLDGTNLLPLWTGAIAPRDWPNRTLLVQHIKAMIQQPYQHAAAYTQRYKMVAYPQAARTSHFEPDVNHLELELYDIENDPNETTNIAPEKPEVLGELQHTYARWFEEMKNTRHFQPGRIFIGTDFENPTYLCRYQDASHPYGDSEPIGWPVKIVQTGRYRVTFTRGPLQGEGVLHVNWQSKRLDAHLRPDQSASDFELVAGEGILDIWLELNGQGRPSFKLNHTTTGDVLVQRMK